jgi:hypothetical protein
MQGRRRFLAFVGGAILSLAGLAVLTPGGPTPVRAFNPNTASRVQQRLLSQFSADALGFRSASASARGAPAMHNAQVTSVGRPPCGLKLGSNVKVNQGCLNISASNLQGRGQAQNETAIAVNPLNPNQLVAASNDYTLGDGLAGGINYSSDGGSTWAASNLPVEFTRGSDFSGNTAPRMYWQGGGDPSLAWDSRGNAYFAGLHFNRGSPPVGVSDNLDYSSGVYLYRSTGTGGASWTFPGTPVVTTFQPTTPSSGLPLDDKPYITIDNHTSSPFRDRIYVTFTVFAADGTAYIYEGWSSDYGRTFSSPVLVSTNSSLCPNNYSQIGVVPENGNNCDENQFSDPFTGADGNLYVVFSSYNTTAATSTAPNSDNRVQVLLTKSTDGGNSFGAPVQVGAYYDLPDCGTYQGGQDEFRACVPEQGAQQDSVFRTANYPSGAVDPTNSSKVMVSYGSYINEHSNTDTGCTPNGVDGDAFVQLYNGVKTGACANKILVSVSKDAGASFSATGANPRDVTLVSSGKGQAHADQWFQWAAFNQNGEFVVSYYDRGYGSDITNADMDVTLSVQEKGSDDLSFDSRRVTSSSMPPPTEFPDAQGNSVFFGDYSGLAVWSSAHPLWADTRDADLFDCGTNPPAVCTGTAPNGLQANDEDIFTASLGT